jgi:hypothetical protein
MADYNVALGINPPDPQGGLNTLSKIMSLGQQGLAIRGQQSENITKASQATVAQQSATENQNLAQLMSDPIKNGLVDQDGNPTKDAQKIVMQAAPTTGQDHYEKLVSAATKKVAFNSAANDLRSSERAEASNVVSGIATRAEKASDITDGLDAWLETKKGLPEYSNYQTIAGTAKEAINHLAKRTSGNTPPAIGEEPWRKGALNMAASLLPPSATVGPGGLATPQATTVQTTGGTQGATAAPALQGGGLRTAGPVVAAPPTLTTNATGQLVRVAPGATGASVVPTAAPPGGAPGQPAQNANPTTAQAVGQRGQAEAVSQRVAQVQAQADSTIQAQDALSRAKAIVESGESPDTGTSFESKRAISNLLSSAGFDSKASDNMNTLSKNLARYEASRATAVGLGGTDAARELAHSGSPNTQLDNKALKGIIRQSLATEKILAGYANIQSKTNDPQQQLQNEVALRSILHPIETMEYTMSRNKGEAEEYLNSHGLTHADIAKSVAQMKQFGLM